MQPVTLVRTSNNLGPTQTGHGFPLPDSKSLQGQRHVRDWCLEGPLAEIKKHGIYKLDSGDDDKSFHFI